MMKLLAYFNSISKLSRICHQSHATIQNILQILQQDLLNQSMPIRNRLLQGSSMKIHAKLMKPEEQNAILTALIKIIQGYIYKPLHTLSALW